MKIFKIVSITEGQGRVYSAARDHAFVPAFMRPDLEEGKFVLVVDEVITEVEKNPDGSNKTDSNGKLIPTGVTATRATVSAIRASFKEIAILKNEDKIYATAEEAVIAEQSAVVAKELGFELSAVAKNI